MIVKNNEIVQEIINHALEFYDIPFSELQAFIKDAEANGRYGDGTTVNQCLKHFVRDWSDDGSHERVETFPRVLRTLEGLFPGRSQRSAPKVLVPGSGLGRIAHEIAALDGMFVLASA